MDDNNLIEKKRGTGAFPEGDIFKMLGKVRHWLDQNDEAFAGQTRERHRFAMSATRQTGPLIFFIPVDDPSN